MAVSFSLSTGVESAPRLAGDSARNRINGIDSGAFLFRSAAKPWFYAHVHKPGKDSVR